MIYKCLSLFPEMLEQGLRTSIIGKALEQGILQLKTYNIRDYTMEKHGRVDDYTYGGGAGMLMQAQPVFDAFRAALSDGHAADSVNAGRRSRTIYVTPQGKTFTQKIAEELSGEEELIFLCGHYEGIDERVLDEIVTDRISIGDYVLTGGELAVMVMIDAISRLVPGVLGNEISADTETFQNDLLEYPQYTRPEVWHGKSVPKILLSGNRREVEKWRTERSVERTKQIRPDLYEKYLRKKELTDRLLKEKRENIHLIESLRRGLCEIWYDDGRNVILYDESCRICMVKIEEEQRIKEVYEKIPAKASKIIVNLMENAGNPSNHTERYGICQEAGAAGDNVGQWVRKATVQSACYTENVPAKVKYRDIRRTETNASGRRQMYELYYEQQKYAVIETMEDGSIGMPVLLQSRGERNSMIADMVDFSFQIKKSLLAFMINRCRDSGGYPFVFIKNSDEEALDLILNLGLYSSKGWFEIYERRMV